jgi:ferritin-like metal-binding protein YciE
MSATALTSQQNHGLANRKPRRTAYEDKATTGVGWMSLALGAAELVAPCAVARMIGAKSNPKLIQALGAREIISGLGILACRRPEGWLWGRVAGDIMDLAVLGLAPLEAEDKASAKRAAATVAIAGVTLLDSVLAIRHTLQDGNFNSGARTPGEQVVHFLSDMYSVEQQALSQLVKAPHIAGDAMLADAFRNHYSETELQSDLVRDRLTGLGGSPSKIKDAIMRLGGKGFLAFARAMPETPGRLVVHSYAYEAMEWAGYEMLIRFATAAGDTETIEMAEAIRDEEREMMHRLERGFDAAEHITHVGLSQEELTDHLQMHLNEVHAFEVQAIQLLEKSRDHAPDRVLATVYDDLLDKSREHADAVQRKLNALGTSPSTLKDSALAIGGLNWVLFFQIQQDAAPKLAAFIYAVLHLQIGSYELLARTASRAKESAITSCCQNIASEKRDLAVRLEESFDVAAQCGLVIARPEPSTKRFLQRSVSG